MAEWRLIVTDSETVSGVAPVCENGNGSDVDDCCPKPHLECWTPTNAKAVRDMLNRYSVEVCE